MRTNDEVAARLEEMADLLEAQGVEYKPTAYRRAAENVREHPVPVRELAADGPDAVAEIERVGDAIASKIVEFVETGEIEELEELREELPVDMAALTSVEGVGPKTVGKLYEELGIVDLDDLERAASEGEIREVKGFGAKTEQNILEGIDFARQAQERALLGEARPLGERVRDVMAGHDAVAEAELAGSNRRWRETIGDVDVLVASDDPDAVVETFTTWEDASEVIEAGTTKAGIRAAGLRVDLRVVAPDEFGAALQYFTGSVDHNVKLRNLAIDRDLKMNEYGMFDVSDVDDAAADGDAAAADATTEAADATTEAAATTTEAADGDGDGDAETADARRVGERIAGETEASMYEALDLPWIPPELREDRGEVEAAREGDLPDLLEVGDVRGDLHTHTDWSDGDLAIAEMVEGAAMFGHDYVCISDHAAGPGIFGNTGLSEDELREQMDAVAEARESADGDVTVFHGIETNVDAEGDLSTDDDVLADLDVVVASPHSALDQDRETATDRLVRAVEHPHVDLLGHPAGRLINDRPGLDLDVERLALAAADAGTALEVNANPHRLDLRDEAVRVAVDAGATIAINTDAHSTPEYGLMRYGVHTARRGWAEAADVLNTRDADGIREFCG